MKKIAVVLIVDAILWAALWIAWASSFVGCASVHSRGVTGMLGRAIKSPTSVACAASLPDSDCDQVRQACEHINSASGMELLHWTVNDTADVMVSAARAVPVDPFAESQEGMHTGYQVYIGTGVFALRKIETVTGPDCCTEATRQTQLRHELLHALGLPHNVWDPMSLMTPGVPYNMATPRPLSDSDIAMLRAIYQRSFGL